MKKGTQEVKTNQLTLSTMIVLFLILNVASGYEYAEDEDNIKCGIQFAACNSDMNCCADFFCSLTAYCEKKNRTMCRHFGESCNNSKDCCMENTCFEQRICVTKSLTECSQAGGVCNNRDECCNMLLCADQECRLIVSGATASSRLMYLAVLVPVCTLYLMYL